VSIGTDGNPRTALTSIGDSLEGAVRGRFTETRRRIPLSPPSFLGRTEGCLRRWRCSHCFAVSCLLLDAESVSLVTGVDMLVVWEELLANSVR
jgi:hypothetical protein